MRDIKFRAWDKSSERMLDYADILEAENGTLLGDLWINDAPDYKLMQYTGLKDKNGTEIYEEDIVQFLHDGPGDEQFLKAEVLWSELEHGWQIKGHAIKKGTYQHDFISDVEYEVIGNIYENPDLLPQEKHDADS